VQQAKTFISNGDKQQARQILNEFTYETLIDAFNQANSVLDKLSTGWPSEETSTSIEPPPPESEKTDGIPGFSVFSILIALIITACVLVLKYTIITKPQTYSIH
jgi:hypothetical protein